MSPRHLVPHGTRSAAERHRYHCEPLCAPCGDADRQYERERWRRRAAATTTDIDITTDGDTT